MMKPEYQVIRFDNSIATATDPSGNPCGTYCEYQCGSENPGCQGVCVGEACQYQCPPD